LWHWDTDRRLATKRATVSTSALVPTRWSKRATGFLTGLAATATVLFVAASASATFPGRNGGFAYGIHFDYETDDVSYTIWGWRVGFVNQDGDGRHFVTPGTEPAFSPGGGMLAVSAIGGAGPRGLGGWGIRTLRLTRKGLAPLSPGIDRAPTWSPSGRRLAFERFRCTGISETAWCPRTRGIWTVRRREADPVRLISEGSEPAWSSRNEIAYVVATDFCRDCPSATFGDVRVIPAAGGAPRTLARGSAPDWSPSGEQLAFVSGSAYGRAGLSVINRDGTGLRRLYRTSRGIESPTWSPDGRRIAFLVDDTVITVPSRGGPPRQLFDLPCPPKLCADGSTSNVTDLAWQPLPPLEG
jgi:Tol biopolymer transport system component